MKGKKPYRKPNYFGAIRMVEMVMLNRKNGIRSVDAMAAMLSVTPRTVLRYQRALRENGLGLNGEVL